MGFKKRARRGKNSKKNEEKREEDGNLDSSDRILGYGGGKSTNHLDRHWTD